MGDRGFCLQTRCALGVLSHGGAVWLREVLGLERGHRGKGGGICGRREKQRGDPTRALPDQRAANPGGATPQLRLLLQVIII